MTHEEMLDTAQGREAEAAIKGNRRDWSNGWQNEDTSWPQDRPHSDYESLSREWSARQSLDTHYFSIYIIRSTVNRMQSMTTY